VIVYFSYRQTIAAYPSGGGSYTVARFNLGAPAGLLAAARAPRRFTFSRLQWAFPPGLVLWSRRFHPATAHRFSLHLHSDRHHCSQSRGVREAVCFRSSYLSVCGHTSHNYRRRHSPVLVNGGHPTPAVSLPPPPPMTEAISLLAAAQGFR